MCFSVTLMASVMESEYFPFILYVGSPKECNNCLISSTVAKRTPAIFWCTVKVVHVKRATVLYFDIDRSITAILPPVKTYLPGHLS